MSNVMKNNQTSGQRIMPETRKTSFHALSIYSRVEISRSASETDGSFYFGLKGSHNVIF